MHQVTQPAHAPFGAFASEGRSNSVLAKFTNYPPTAKNLNSVGNNAVSGLGLGLALVATTPIGQPFPNKKDASATSCTLVFPMGLVYGM